jgi:NADPH-dependent 2,4-dienoyl-CoA reductase/sulfur reductase-like enzyme
MRMPDHCTVLIVGAGPAGLAAALELRREGVRDVLVVEREDEAGGVPRLCGHIGFGLRDLHRVDTGPGYARHYREQAAAAGIEVRTSTTVTGWTGATGVMVTGPTGPSELEAQAVLLATGCFERSRAARLVHGRRPQGVYTTGSLQRFVYQYGQAVGRRAVVVGAETVSFSALLTLGHVHGSAVALVTEHPAHQLPFLYTPAKWYLADLRSKIPLIPRTRVQRILGGRRVEAVELLRLESGQTEVLPCDTVIFTGAWVPESEVARLAGLGLDPATRSPRVDPSLGTTVPGVFAAGNLLRGALAADQAALEGRHAARRIAHYLADGTWPEKQLPLEAGDQVAWVSPNLVTSRTEQLPFGAILFQADAFCSHVQATVSQGDRVLHRQAYRKLAPNQPARLGIGWLAQVDAGGPALRLDIV